MNITFNASPGITRTTIGVPAREDFTVTLVADPRSIGVTGSTTEVIKEVTYNVDTTIGTEIVSNLSVVQELGVPYPVTLTSETPNTCTVDAQGRVTRVANGTCSILARGRHTRRRMSQSLSVIGNTSVQTSIASFAAGSLRGYLYDQQMAALAGVTPGAAAQRAGVYENTLAAGTATTISMAGSQGGANANNFLRAQGKSGFAGFELDLLDQVLDHGTGSAGWRAWITPHHFLTWRGHGASSSAGKWVAINGEVIVEYSATAWMGSLAKVLAPNWQTYMTAVQGSWWDVGTGISLWGRIFNTYTATERRWIQPLDLHRAPYVGSDLRSAYQKLATNGTYMNGGDSGSPIFCGINRQLVMFSHAMTQGNAGSLYYADLAPDINAALATLNASGTYTLGTVDLSAAIPGYPSGFTAYP